MCVCVMVTQQGQHGFDTAMNNRTISMCSIGQVNRNRLLAVSATSSECGVGQSSFVVADRCVDVIADASTYFEARARCRGRGQAADLVQLKTDADNAQAAAALRAFVNSPETAAPRAFWIGLTRSQWSWETPGELSPLATRCRASLSVAHPLIPLAAC